MLLKGESDDGIEQNLLIYFTPPCSFSDQWIKGNVLGLLFPSV